MSQSNGIHYFYLGLTTADNASNNDTTVEKVEASFAKRGLPKWHSGELKLRYIFWSIPQRCMLMCHAAALHM